MEQMESEDTYREMAKGKPTMNQISKHTEKQVDKQILTVSKSIIKPL